MASKRPASNSKPHFLLISFLFHSVLLFCFFFTILSSIPPSSLTEQPACSGNFVELDVCLDALRALSRGRRPSKNYCCSLIGNLVQLEDNLSCLCSALEDTVSDVIERGIPSASLSLVFNYCGSEIPPDFQCGNLQPSYSSM